MTEVYGLAVILVICVIGRLSTISFVRLIAIAAWRLVSQHKDSQRKYQDRTSLKQQESHVHIFALQNYKPCNGCHGYENWQRDRYTIAYKEYTLSLIHI